MAYNSRGFAYNELGQYERAIQDLNEAIRLDPRDASAYAFRAVTFALLGMDAEAQKDIERAVELGFDRARLELGVEQLKQDRQR